MPHLLPSPDLHNPKLTPSPSVQKKVFAARRIQNFLQESRPYTPLVHPPHQKSQETVLKEAERRMTLKLREFEMAFDSNNNT